MSEIADCEHCWHRAKFQHAVPNHRDDTCCRCGVPSCVTIETEQEPGHGPHVQMLRVVGQKRRVFGERLR